MLGVSPKATMKEIKKAYRELAARYHPDKHRDNELADLAQQKLTEVNTAYEILKDDARRAAYDRERVSGHQTMPTSSPQDVEIDQLGTLIRSFVKIIIVMAVVFFALRFVRSPRALLVIGAAILIAWFLPRIIKKMKR